MDTVVVQKPCYCILAYSGLGMDNELRACECIDADFHVCFCRFFSRRRHCPLDTVCKSTVHPCACRYLPGPKGCLMNDGTKEHECTCQQHSPGDCLAKQGHECGCKTGGPMKCRSINQESHQCSCPHPMCRLPNCENRKRLETMRRIQEMQRIREEQILAARNRKALDSPA